MSVKDKIKSIKVNKRMISNSKIDVDLNVNEEERTIEFSFASRTPYLREFGYEVIDVSSIDMSRLNDGAPLLFNHDFEKYIGIIRNAYYDQSKDKAICVAEFDEHPLADQVFNSIKKNRLKGASLGYEIVGVYENGEIDGIPCYKVLISVYEISIAPVPADPNVGINRSNDEKDNEISIEVKKDEKEEEKEEIIEEIDKKDASKVESDDKICDNIENKSETETDKEEEDLKEDENLNKNGECKMTREEEILAMAEKYNEKELAFEFIKNKTKTATDFANEILMKRSSEATDTSKSNVKNNGFISGLDEDMEGFNAQKAIRSLVSGVVDKETEEYSRSIEQKYGIKRRNHNSIFVPNPFISGSYTRDVTVANAASAGSTISTNKDKTMARTLFDKTVLAKLGVRYMPNLVGNVEFPKDSGDMTAQYVGEKEAADGSSVNITYTKLTKKSASSNVDITRDIMLLSDFDLYNYLYSKLSDRLVRFMDSEAFLGLGGDKKVQGLLNMPGLATVESENGVLTYVKAVELESTVEYQNALFGNGKYLTNSKVKGLLKTTQKANGTGFLLENDMMNGYEVVTTNALKTREDGTNDIIFGDFSSLIFGSWNYIELIADPFSKSKQGITSITAFCDFDVAVEHIESFALCNDIKTA